MAVICEEIPLCDVENHENVVKVFKNKIFF